MELTLFLFLLCKHAIVDIGVQRLQGNLHKYNYNSKLAQQHYGAHGIGTFIIMLFFAGPVTAILAGAFDWIAHWHIDHTKARINQRFEWNSTHNAFWYMVTIDQMLHFATYWLIIVLI